MSEINQPIETVNPDTTSEIPLTEMPLTTSQWLYAITNTFLFKFIIIFLFFVIFMNIFSWTNANISVVEPYLFYIIAFIILYLFLEKRHVSVLFDNEKKE